MKGKQINYAELQASSKLSCVAKLPSDYLTISVECLISSQTNTITKIKIIYLKKGQNIQ